MKLYAADSLTGVSVAQVAIALSNVKIFRIKPVIASYI